TFDQVAGRLTEALRLTRGLDPRRRLGAVLVGAEMARREGHLDLAARLAMEARVVGRERGSVAEPQATVLAGCIHAALADFAEAHRLLEEARSKLEVVDAAPAFRARVAAATAQLALATGSPDHEAALDRARAMFDAAGYRSLASDLVGSLGLALLAR